MTQPAESGRARHDQPRFITDILQAREEIKGTLAGKTAFITGGNREIGGGITLSLALAGANVFVMHRDSGKERRSQAVLDAVRECDVTSEFVIGDITNPEDRIHAQQIVKTTFNGNLDLLVLNASGPTEETNVIGNNELVTSMLPYMKPGAKIILMQSTPGHFSQVTRNTGIMPESYNPVANAKYKGEQSLLTRQEELEARGISLVIVTPPLVPETINARMFTHEDTTFAQKNRLLSEAFGLPETATIQEIGKKIALIAATDTIPFGYTELFGPQDARSILKQWYGDRAIFVDTFSPEQNTAKTIITPEYCEGHFKNKAVCPAHVLAEAATQAAGLIAISQLDNLDIVPMTQNVAIDLKGGRPVTPNDIITFTVEKQYQTRRGFESTIRITSGDTYVARVTCEVNLIAKKTAERLLQ